MFSGNDAFTAMWSVVETCIAIVCACLPTLRPVLDVVFSGSILGSIRSGSDHADKGDRSGREVRAEWLKLTGVRGSSGRLAGPHS